MTELARGGSAVMAAVSVLPCTWNCADTKVEVSSEGVLAV